MGLPKPILYLVLAGITAATIGVVYLMGSGVYRFIEGLFDSSAAGGGGLIPSNGGDPSHLPDEKYISFILAGLPEVMRASCSVQLARGDNNRVSPVSALQPSVSAYCINPSSHNHLHYGVLKDSSPPGTSHQEKCVDFIPLCMRVGLASGDLDWHGYPNTRARSDKSWYADQYWAHGCRKTMTGLLPAGIEASEDLIRAAYTCSKINVGHPPQLRVNAFTSGTDGFYFGVNKTIVTPSETVDGKACLDLYPRPYTIQCDSAVLKFEALDPGSHAVSKLAKDTELRCAAALYMPPTICDYVSIFVGYAADIGMHAKVNSRTWLKPHLPAGCGYANPTACTSYSHLGCRHFMYGTHMNNYMAEQCHWPKDKL